MLILFIRSRILKDLNDIINLKTNLFLNEEKTTPAISIAIPTEQKIRGLCLYDPEQLETHVTLSTPHNPTIRSRLGKKIN